MEPTTSLPSVVLVGGCGRATPPIVSADEGLVPGRSAPEPVVHRSTRGAVVPPDPIPRQVRKAPPSFSNPDQVGRSGIADHPPRHVPTARRAPLNSSRALV